MSRELLDLERAEREKERDEDWARFQELGRGRERDNAAYGAEIRRLTDIIVELKREGFHPSPRPDVLTNLEPDLPDTVLQAINSRAQPNSELWRLLVTGARQHLAGDGSNADEVAKLVYVGGEPEEDGA